MGVVYKVRDRRSGDVLAVKTMHHLDPEHLLRLKDEFRAVIDLRHGNLVRLGELVEAGGLWFFTMELVDGVPFTHWVRGTRPSKRADSSPTSPTVQGVLGKEPIRDPAVEGRADEGRLRSAMRQLVAALEALHQHGRVHRDVKPSNVLVTDEGRVVLLDFGLATSVARQRPEGVVAGTIEYMAPEQVRGEAVGPAADWYAAGVLLYECLTGRVPFDGTVMEIFDAKCHGLPRPPSSRADDVPADLEALCLALLDVDPAGRPGAAELRARLDAGAPGVAAAPVPFVGRQRELAALGKHAAGLHRGAVTVLVEGESGIGKTSLVHALVERIERDDPRAVVLTGRCHDRESLPFRAFDGIVDELSRVLKRMPEDEVAAILPPRPARLARLFPVLARVGAFTAGDTEDVAPRELRATAFEQLRGLLLALAARAPLILTVDDLQWADDDSLDLMVHLLAEPDSPRLLLLGTMRPGADVLRDRLVARGLSAPAVLPIGALDAADARVLAERALAGSGRAGAAHALAMEAEGHPGYIRELARTAELPTAGAPGLEVLLWRRIQALPPAQQRLLEALCLAAGPLAPHLLAAAGGVDDVALAGQIEELRRRDLVAVREERIAPYHDRVRAAVLTNLPDDALRGGHKRLALALEAEPDAPVEDLYRHWLEAGRRGQAATYAVKAADAAIRALRFHRAAELYRAAIELGEPLQPKWRAALHERLGETLGLAGDGIGASEALLVAAGALDDAHAPALRRRAADHLLAAGHYAQGMVVLRGVLDEAGLGYPEGKLATLIAFLRARARLRLRGLEPRAVSGPPDAATVLQIEAAWSASRGIGIVDAIRGSYYHARFLRLALDAGARDRLVDGYGLEAVYLATNGARVAARVAALEARARAIAAEDGSDFTAGVVELNTSMVHFMLGRFLEARTEADAASGRFAAHCPGAHWELRAARVWAAWACWFSGELRQLSIRVRGLLRDADPVGDRYSSVLLRTGVNNAAWLVVDDPDGALRAVREAQSGWPAADVQMHHYYGTIARVNAHLYAGDAEAAMDAITTGWRPVERSLLLRVKFAEIAMTELRARAHLALGHADAARRDAARLRRTGEPWALASTLLIEAGAAFLDKNTAETLRLLTSAVAAARLHRLPTHESAARIALARLSADDPTLARAHLLSEGVVDPDRLARVLYPV